MKKGSKGFTLVELVVVIAVLAILGGIALVRVNSAREESAKNVCYANRTTIAKAYQFVLVRNGAVSLQNFINSPEDYDTYYASKPVCPLGGAYTESNGAIVCSQAAHKDSVAAGGASADNDMLISDSLLLTINALEKLDRTLDGEQLNELLRTALGGEFLPVEDSIVQLAFGDTYKGAPLTWRSDTADRRTIYFAGDDRDNSNKRAYLLIVDGVLYKSNDTKNGAPNGINVAGVSGLSEDKLAEKLTRFTPIGKISY